jgi:hypothetical protein
MKSGVTGVVLNGRREFKQGTWTKCAQAAASNIVGVLVVVGENARRRQSSQDRLGRGRHVSVLVLVPEHVGVKNEWNEWKGCYFWRSPFCSELRTGLCQKAGARPRSTMDNDCSHTGSSTRLRTRGVTKHRLELSQLSRLLQSWRGRRKARKKTNFPSYYCYTGGSHGRDKEDDDDEEWW